MGLQYVGAGFGGLHKKWVEGPVVRGLWRGIVSLFVSGNLVGLSDWFRICLDSWGVVLGCFIQGVFYGLFF